MRRFSTIALVSLVSLLLAASCFAATTLKTIAFAARESVWVDNLKIFTDAAEKKSKGELRFRIVGGPEAIPPFEQIDALRRGIVDVALLPGAYFVPQLPEADAMKLSPFTPWEERDRGIYTFYNELMQQSLGVFFLGKLSGGVPYHLYLKRPVSAPDLKGLKIRVTPIYEPFVRRLGGTPVTMAPSEIYIALERVVVDGFGWPAIGIRDLGWQEVVKYMISPGFYTTDVCVLVNLGTWKRLDDASRNLLTSVMEQAEKESSRYSLDLAQRDVDFLKEKGVTVIQFTGPDRDRFLRSAAEAAWEKVLSRSGENGRRLKSLMEAE